jgi:alkylhydroperoxidase family enzyme
LQGFVANNGVLGKALDVKTRERIALAVAQVDGCDYSLSAHTVDFDFNVGLPSICPV